MRYHSTRSLQDTVSGREAVFRGLAPDGGLYVTDRLNSTHIDPAVSCLPLAAACLRHFCQAFSLRTFSDTQRVPGLSIWTVPGIHLFFMKSGSGRFCRSVFCFCCLCDYSAIVTPLMLKSL